MGIFLRNLRKNKFWSLKCKALNKNGNIQLKNSNFIAGRPKAALLFWFFGGFRCGVPLFVVILVI